MADVNAIDESAVGESLVRSGCVGKSQRKVQGGDPPFAARVSRLAGLVTTANILALALELGVAPSLWWDDFLKSGAGGGP